MPGPGRGRVSLPAAFETPFRVGSPARRAGRMVREELVLFLGVSLALIYLSAVGVYYFEHDSQPEQFASVLMASAWRSSMPAACNRLTAACVSSTRLFYELQLCRRDELAWYKSAVQEKARVDSAGFGS